MPKKRRVFYCDDILYRKLKIACALLGESMTDFTVLSLNERINREFTEEQQARLFHRT